jgi:hypothetical protein
MPTLPNGVAYPGAKEADAFTAGWKAALESTHHEWGPAPPSTPTAAKRVWEQTCDLGHTSRVAGCPACSRKQRAAL